MTTDCKNKIHPFQNDPGTSQHQRGVSDLLSADIQIDGRNLAALLEFFAQLSRHVNYYNEQLLVNDWQPFFDKSLPFTLAAIARYDKTGTLRQLEKMNTRFRRRPSVNGLNNLFSYIYSNVIKKINGWQQQVSGSGLPLETVLDKRIQNKLSGPLKSFIQLTNTGTYWLCTRNFNFTTLLENPIWQLSNADIIAKDSAFPASGESRRTLLLKLYEETRLLVQSFLEVFSILGHSAEQSMEQSLLPLKEELKEQHTPHLALVFAFLKLFQSLQADLNGFTKKHLDYFYRKVLLIQSKEAVPDQVHVLVEIQQQLDKYLLKKGLHLKDGKDNNKAEIYFATEDEIVLNKTQVAEQKTLFLNTTTGYDQTLNNKQSECTRMDITEGIYIATDATKADGIDKAFTEGILPSRAALGAKESKYKDPEHSFILPYANARLGCLFASPVLLLKEGRRTITLTLKLSIDEDLCSKLAPLTGNADNCCEEDKRTTGTTVKATDLCDKQPMAHLLYSRVSDILNKSFVYINRVLLAEAVKKGLNKEAGKILSNLLTVTHSKNDAGSVNCYCETKEKLFEKTLEENDFKSLPLGDLPEPIKAIFKPRRAMNLVFSGENNWIQPKAIPTFTLNMGSVSLPGEIILTASAILQPDEEPVTFYQSENLKEEFSTHLPAARLEIDDKIKIKLNGNCKVNKKYCCERDADTSDQYVSLYHFFREARIISGTKIDVEVCGVRNLIVQNDDTIEDVNIAFQPFGVRPVVGSNFYIGSHEVFIKNWQKIWVNADWKSKPKPNLNSHYQFYDYEPFEDGSNAITEASFKYGHSLLENGEWKAALPVQPPYQNLFNQAPAVLSPCVPGFHQPADKDTYYFARTGFNNSAYTKQTIVPEELAPFNIKSTNGFLKLTLQGVGFQHDRYPFVVARHMIALAGLIDPVELVNLQNKIKESRLLILAIQNRINAIQTEINDIQLHIGHAINDIDTDLAGIMIQLNNRLLQALTELGVPNIGAALGHINFIANTLALNITTELNQIKAELALIEADKTAIQALLNNNVPGGINFNNSLNPYGLFRLAEELRQRIQYIFDKLKVNEAIKAALPKEPYTPAIKFLSLDYTATADINDIDLIHLYPYTGTYKTEITTQNPSLLPTFCDEGNLFIGLKDLVPGSNVPLLFQLAEATADSEAPREKINWYYLENNTWKQLRAGFEILNDDTNGLTTSGIIKFALPANMTNENTILTKGLHWIRASIPCKSRSVSEIIAIHTQAIKASFTNETANDTLRLAQPLPAGSVSKLKVADSSVKKITQPYASFGGRVPEGEGHYYTRVSELLRHKNRAIQKMDYELMVLETFPQLFKVKCINHSYWLDAGKFENDFPMAPGYVLLAVIPDLNKLKAAQNFEPKAPVSLLEEIERFLKKHSSPFVRIKAVNPRYEKVNLCVGAKLLPDKDAVYYKEKLAQDLREFFAPWAIGEYDKLSFGQTINRSDIIKFLETRNYLDYIIGLRMQHESVDESITSNPNSKDMQEIAPISPRSILIAGNIDVCINQKDCEKWCICRDAENGCCTNNMEKLNDYCGPK